NPVLGSDLPVAEVLHGNGSDQDLVLGHPFTMSRDIPVPEARSFTMSRDTRSRCPETTHHRHRHFFAESPHRLRAVFSRAAARMPEGSPEFAGGWSRRILPA